LGNYEYRIDSGVYPMATPFNGIASGTHTIYVRDTTTGCEVSTTGIATSYANTGFNLNTTPVTVEVVEQLQLRHTSSGVNDNPVYTYIKWNNSRRGSDEQ
jgi:hypothetical protein